MGSQTYATVNAYITDVRVILQDTLSPYRYQDSELVTALNVSLLEVRRLRADIIFEGYDCDEIPTFTVNDDTPVCIEPTFRLAIAHGIAAHALMRDQEDIQDARATTFFGIFNDMLLGVRPRPLNTGQPPQNAGG